MVLSGFIFILIVFDIYSLDFYFSVYLFYVAHVIYEYGMAIIIVLLFFANSRLVLLC